TLTVTQTRWLTPLRALHRTPTFRGIVTHHFGVTHYLSPCRSVCANAHYFASTRAFSSSNQFSTTTRQPRADDVEIGRRDACRPRVEHARKRLDAQESSTAVH